MHWDSTAERSLIALIRQHGSDWEKIGSALGRSANACRFKAKRMHMRAKRSKAQHTQVGDVFAFSAPTATVTASEAEETEESRESLSYLRARQQQLEAENKRLMIALGQQQEIANAITAAVQALPPYPQQYEYRKPSRSTRKVIAVMCWSDWHIGEIVLPSETEGFGAYNWEIAQKSFYAMLDGFFRWVDVQRAAYQIDEIVIVGIGDYISGNIHQELLMTQEFPPTEQAVKAGWLIGEGLRRAATHAEKLRFVGVGADNHGRLFAKPQAKRKYQSNFSFVSHAVAREMTRNLKNLNWVEPMGMKHIEKINGYDFLIEHGDTVRSWMGIPYYGIERARGREAARRMNTTNTFHYMLVGHYHVPALVSGNILINGALSGTNEFDHSCGRHAKPAQLAFLVHPEWGIFNLLTLKSRT